MFAMRGVPGRRAAFDFAIAAVVAVEVVFVAAAAAEVVAEVSLSVVAALAEVGLGLMVFAGLPAQPCGAGTL